MNASRWQRVQELFEGALARPTAERAAWLADQCGDDATLQTEVDGLLQADAEAGQSIVEAVQGGQELLLGKRPGSDTVVGPLGSSKANPDSGDVDSAAITALSPGGGRFATPPVDAEGRTRFGRYTVDAWIGQGGFGVVYRGHDPVLKRRVAIKTCTGLDADLRRRFFREGQIAAGLQHPNIVTVHELGVESGVPYMVQEFLDGDDLRQLVPKHAELPLEQRLRILHEVARGLDHAHRAGVLHRDVKPANIRILTDGSVKILDFGIAKLLDAESQLTGTGTTLGTVGYLAPEQLRSEPIDARADVFSFGVVAYELLTGQRPFRGQDFSQVSYQLLFVEPDSISDAWPGCPAALVELVNQCLAKEREGRPADFGVIASRLEALLDQERSGGTLAVADPVLPAAPRSKEPVSGASDSALASGQATAVEGATGRGRWWLAGGGLAAVLLAAFWWQGVVGDRASVPESAPMVEDADRLAAALVPGAGQVGEDPRGQGPADLSADPSADSLADAERPSELASSETVDAEPSEGVDGGVLDPTGGPSEGEETRAPESEPSPAVEIAEAGGLDSAGSTPTSSGIADPSSPPGLPEDPPSLTSTAPQELETTPGVGNDAQPTLAVLEEPSQDEEVPPRPTAGDATDPAAVSAALASANDGPVVGSTIGSGAEERSGAGGSGGETTEPPPPAAAPIERGAFLVDGPGVTPPQLLGGFDPVYPRRARRSGIEQRVVVKVLVDEDGKVLQAIVPEDEYGFGDEARRAALRARFAPATQQGVAGKMWMNLPFEFKLRN